MEIWANTYPSRLESISTKTTKLQNYKRRLSGLFHFQILEIEAIALIAFKFFTKALSDHFQRFFKSNNYFHNQKTRFSFKIHKEQARTNYKKYSVRFKGCEIWNKLPIFIKNSESFNIFKKGIKKYYDLLK